MFKWVEYNKSFKEFKEELLLNSWGILIELETYKIKTKKLMNIPILYKEIKENEIILLGGYFDVEDIDCNAKVLRYKKLDMEKLINDE